MDLLQSLGVQSLLLFATTVFVVNATPGADMLLTFTNTMKHGVRGGVATSAGISAGSLVYMQPTMPQSASMGVPSFAICSRLYRMTTR